LRQEPNIVPVLVCEAGKLRNGEIYSRQHPYFYDIFVNSRHIE